MKCETCGQEIENEELVADGIKQQFYHAYCLFSKEPQAREVEVLNVVRR